MEHFHQYFLVTAMTTCCCFYRRILNPSINPICGHWLSCKTKFVNLTVLMLILDSFFNFWYFLEKSTPIVLVIGRRVAKFGRFFFIKGLSLIKYKWITRRLSFYKENICFFILIKNAYEKVGRLWPLHIVPLKTW